MKVEGFAEMVSRVEDDGGEGGLGLLEEAWD